MAKRAGKAKKSGARRNLPINYQKQYRERHPAYVVRNRELQKVRNKKRSAAPVTMIVKTNALVLQPWDDGVYLLSKVKKK